MNTTMGSGMTSATVPQQGRAANNDPEAEKRRPDLTESVGDSGGCQASVYTYVAGDGDGDGDNKDRAL
jgi:hypothetical protein